MRVERVSPKGVIALILTYQICKILLDIATEILHTHRAFREAGTRKRAKGDTSCGQAGTVLSGKNMGIVSGQNGYGE